MGILQDIIGTGEGERVEFFFQNLEDSTQEHGVMTAHFKLSPLLPESEHSAYIGRFTSRLTEMLGGSGVAVNAYPQQRGGKLVIEATIEGKALAVVTELERELDRATAALDSRGL